jgi:valyl-tRNA synthetase
VHALRKELETFRFNDATRTLYGFVWGEYCDWYLELVKPRLYETGDPGTRGAAQAVVLSVLDSILRMLHPFMPFITEEIWQALPRNIQKGNRVHSIMIQPYPVIDKKYIQETAEKEMDILQKTIGTIRTIRSEMNIPIERKARVIVDGPKKGLKILGKHENHIKRLAMVQTLHLGGDAEKPKEAATGLVGDMEICVPLEGLIDLKAERNRVGREITRLKEN